MDNLCATDVGIFVWNFQNCQISISLLICSHIIFKRFLIFKYFILPENEPVLTFLAHWFPLLIVRESLLRGNFTSYTSRIFDIH